MDKYYYTKPRINIVEVSSYDGIFIEVTKVRKSFFAQYPDEKCEILFSKENGTPSKSDIKKLEKSITTTCIIIENDLFTGETHYCFAMCPRFELLEDNRVTVYHWRTEKFLDLHIKDNVTYVNGHIIKGIIPVIYGGKLALIRETKKVKDEENTYIYSEDIRRVSNKPIKPLSHRAVQLSFY